VEAAALPRRAVPAPRPQRPARSPRATNAVTPRNCAVALLCLLAAGGGLALFVASLDVRDGSLGRTPLSLFGARYR